MKLRYSLLLFLCTLLQISFAQKGEIYGTVFDETNSTLPSVIILKNGNEIAAKTDIDGNYKITNLPDGAYTLTFKFSEYEALTVPGIEIKKGETKQINANLVPLVNEIDLVVITAKIDKSGNTSLEREKQNSAVVADGASSEEMKKRPDSKASDALKRISGASIQDNKFVIIRGLNDRYNSAYINGAPLPSSESDRKAFSFDIFPSVMLENILINKTATPDMPGEFAGGVININTKTPKDSNFQTILLGTSFNTLTTFKNFQTYEGSRTDFLGMDNGTRSLPPEFPSTKDFSGLSVAQRGELAKQMTPSWAIQQKMALPTLNLQYGLNQTFKMGNQRLGLAAAYTYQNNNVTSQNIRREFEERETGTVLKSELKDSVYTRTVLNSGMLNLNYEINSKNVLSFKNLYSLNSEDKVNIRKGVRELDSDPHVFEKSSNRWFTQNNLYSGQLEGKHELSKNTIKLNWNLGYSDVKRNVPNMRRVVYQKNAMTEDDPNEPYYAVIQNNGTIPTAAGNMFWSKTNEQIYSAKYDVVIPMNFEKVKTDFKVGGMHQYRDRSFEARNLGFSRLKLPGISFDNDLLLLPEDQIFAPEHLGVMENGKGGFKLEEATKVSDSYQASSFLNAGFLMFDTKIIEKFRIVGGARLESYRQNFSYVEFGSNMERNIDTTVNDILPSINFIYSITKKMNLRLSYYKTVSRPEFRELAPFAFYNFAMDNILSGNPNLKRAIINNADIRYEIYPGAGQVFSVSGFYKHFNNPIELVNRTGTSGASELYYTNVKSAQNYGVELEYRLKLSTLFKAKENHFLKSTTLFTNLALIKSSVDMSDIIGSQSNRPLQGQSPYIVNAGLFYNNTDKDFSVSLSYNVVGRRIYIVGNVQEPDVWENHRHLLDLQISKSFLNQKLEVKLNIRDALAQKQLFYQDINGNKRYDKGSDNRWQETRFGQTISITASYTF